MKQEYKEIAKQAKRNAKALRKAANWAKSAKTASEYLDRAEKQDAIADMFFKLAK